MHHRAMTPVWLRLLLPRGTYQRNVSRLITHYSAAATTATAALDSATGMTHITTEAHAVDGAVEEEAEGEEASVVVTNTRIAVSGIAIVQSRMNSVARNVLVAGAAASTLR